MWGQTDKIGKGTKANYDAEKQILTFCFNRGPHMTSEDLRRSREKLMSELNKLGFPSRMKYNGEVIVENVTETNIVLEKKNHKLIIHLKEKQPTTEKEKAPPPDESLISFKDQS
jgi:hypothetical protein